jgi:hypothetical protein
MRTDYQTGLSDRDRAGVREQRAWELAFNKQQRDNENRGLYQQYVSSLATQQARVPKGSRIKPLSFDAFSKFLPDDEGNPELRLLIAQNRILQSQVWQGAQRQVANILTDEELELCQFELDSRPEYSGLQLIGNDPEQVKATYKTFMNSTPGYSHDAHFDSLAGFFQRNKLSATLTNLRIAWSLLTDLAIVPPKPSAPAPAPARNVELNSHGVNLNRAAPDPALEEQRARKAYYEEIVCIDPRDGKTGFTAYMLDRADANTYKRLVFGENFIPCIGHVISGNLK